LSEFDSKSSQDEQNEAVEDLDVDIAPGVNEAQLATACHSTW